MRRVYNKLAKQLWLPLYEGDCVTLAECAEHPVEEGLLERILERENLVRALKQVECNGGSKGVDGSLLRNCGHISRDTGQGCARLSLTEHTVRSQ